MSSRTLFILKRRHDYASDPSYSQSYQIATGMYNSAKFVVDMLNDHGREAKLVLVQDANSIDAEVTNYNPTHVVIEGLWVVPSKFTELLSLYRHRMAFNGAGRQWITRVHSELPFLATEGNAIDWVTGYLKAGVYVAPNAERAHEQFTWLAENIVGIDTIEAAQLVPFLPNYYPTDFDPIDLSRLDIRHKDHIDIAIFGAFRPLKNHLQQAFIAAQYAQSINKTLRLHVNGRLDQGGASPMKNVAAFCESIGAEFVEHGWEDRETFLQSLRDVDLLLQVSISETFNIVAADAVHSGTPVLGSNEIDWLYPLYGDAQDVDDCLDKLEILMSNKAFFINGNRTGLRSYAHGAIRKWTHYIPA